jgi:predicted DCC family thiol-disulfide oxidoreductase YuxK
MATAAPRSGAPASRPISLPAGAHHLVFYDGLCGFCDRRVRQILAADKRGVFAFTPLQGENAGALRDMLAAAEGLDSMLLLENADRPAARLRVRSDAVLAIARLTGGWMRAAAWLGRLVPRPLRDRAYAAFARRRRRWFGVRDTCRIPTPAERSHFLP